MNSAHKIILAITVSAMSAIAGGNITNFSSPVTVNNFFRTGDTLWIATSGGLRVHNLQTGDAELINNSRIFPDLHLTSITSDSRGNLWFGSRGGYLYRRTPRGQFTTFSNYHVVSWGISALYTHGDIIIVGSNRGVSLFDPINTVAIRNATSIGNFTNPRVNVIEFSQNSDTLFLGCEEGTAFLAGLNSVPLSQRNFYDRDIWRTRPGARVVSFVHTTTHVLAQSSAASGFRGALVTAADSGWLLKGGARMARIAREGNIISLYNEDDRRLWIGTDELFYYSYDEETLPVHHRMDGFTQRRSLRVMVASNSDVWVLPTVTHRVTFWHDGVYRYDGRNWYRYNQQTHGGFGYLGDSYVRGIVEGNNNSVWVGTQGGSVKHIDPVRNNVAQLIVGDADFRDFNLVFNNEGNIAWGRVDAVAIDKSGYLWISVWGSNLGSLICYDQRYPPRPAFESDPVRARYRRFFTEPPLQTENIRLLSVDANNRIFAYDDYQNRLVIFTHDGNPLENGIDTLRVHSGIGTLTDIKSDDEGNTYIVGTTGFFRVGANSLDMEIIDNTIATATSFAMRDNVFWFGTHANGVLRYVIDMDDNDSEKRTWINESSGLPSNSVFSVSIDKRNGHLWLATSEGVSRLDIGRDVSVSRRGSMRIFPNVFSISGRNQGTTQMTFAELEPQSVVSIYTVSGTLVAKIDASHFTQREWRAEWTPRRSLAPGTYIVTVKPSGRKAKIILTP